MRHNVLHLLDNLHQGGSESQAVQLARLLKESGRYRVHIACLDESGVLRDEAERISADGLPNYPLTSFYNLNAGKQLRRFARHLKEKNISVLHTHDFYTNIFGMAAGALARVPVRIASRRQSAVRPAAQRLLERRAYARADAVIANCEEVRRQLVKEGVPEGRIITLYNGLNLERFAPAQSIAGEVGRKHEILSALKLPKERRFVTIVANLRPVKDHQTFLRAAQRVREAVPDAAFVLAGEGEMADSLRARARELGLEHDVFFTGRCASVAGLLYVTSVCVLSSTSEGFSNSILEYMAASRAVVATDVGGAREAIVEGETGHLVRAGDDESMAAKIIALLKEPERARAMGERGREIVEDRFSCAAQLEHTQNLYERLLLHAEGRAPQTLQESAHGESI